MFFSVHWLVFWCFGLCFFFSFIFGQLEMAACTKSFFTWPVIWFKLFCATNHSTTEKKTCFFFFNSTDLTHWNYFIEIHFIFIYTNTILKMIVWKPAKISQKLTTSTCHCLECGIFCIHQIKVYKNNESTFADAF